MFNIPIYKAEADAGLGKVIQANASIAYCTQVKPADITEANVIKLLAEAGQRFDLDTLFPTKSVLVTSNWNRNDDVFGVEQIWNARSTPVHKPTNINHDHNQIVGHITNTWVIDSEGNSVDEDTPIEDLPSLIHICNGAVIYKHYKEQNLTDRAMELIAQIEANEKFVSMECLFPDFDYALISPDNENYTVARNEETAFLTKHLRVYGGEGNFNGYKVGRYLKNMVFSGKGYVDKPANPDSIIFGEDKPDFNFSDATHKNTINFENGVDNIMGETFTVNNNKAVMITANLKNSKEILMSETNDFYKDELTRVKAEVAELSKANKELQESLANANVEQLKSQIEDLTNQVAAAEEAKKAVTVTLTETQSAFEDLQTTVKEVTESKEVLEAAVEKAKAEKIFSDRVSALIEAGVSKERAEEAAEKFSALSDEQFEETKSLLSEIKPVVDDTESADKAEDKFGKKKDDDKKKKSDDKADAEDLSETLEDVEADASDDSVGSTEADADVDTGNVKLAMAGYFASTFGLTEDSNE